MGAVFRRGLVDVQVAGQIVGSFGDAARREFERSQSGKAKF
jgi:hypothetical protein